MLTAIVGRQSGGKSLLSARIAVDLANEGKRVIVSNGENERDYMSMPRLIASGMTSTARKLIWVAGINERYKFPHDLPLLEEEIVKWKVAAVLIEPLIPHLSGISKRDDRIRDEVLDELAAIASRTNCAIVITDHNLRSAKMKVDLTDLVSIHIAQAIQVIYVVGKDPDDSETHILGLIKPNLTGPRAPLEFTINASDDPHSTEVGLEYVGELESFNLPSLLKGTSGDTGRPPHKLEAAISWLTTFLDNAPDHKWLAKDLKAAGVASGHSRKTLDNAANEIGIVKEPPTGGTNCMWVLPQSVLDDLHGYGEIDEDDDDEEGGEVAGV
jgi:hypothetical protein